MDGNIKITRHLDCTITTQTELAKVLKTSKQNINKMVKDGTIPLADSSGSIYAIEGAYNYGVVVGGGSPNGKLDLNEERAKHEKVKREIAERKLAKIDANLYEAKTVELVHTEMLTTLRTQLLGLPSKFASMLEGKNKDEIYVLTNAEIEEKLNELSEYVPDLFTDEEIVLEDEDEDE